ncbi:YheT family hydrolase [Hymenobacter humi]|uniref:YheT family hydrolase n=1 Tax=Hymenobacter humi TaxID=1411620 RepID=A0ABW2UBD0_9BACT
MPLVSESRYHPPFYLFNGHLQTIVPSLWRNVPDVVYQRERLELPDGDFLNLDWSRLPETRPTDGLAIVSHGLEGDASRPYMRGMVRALNRAGLDALAWNYRSCGGEMNRLLRSYHLGDTDDLHLVVRHALATGRYERVYLVGFSAGGNVTLKYLGEDVGRVPAEVKRAAVFSVPTDLQASSVHISRPQNQVYLRRFLKTLRLKVRAKAEMMPGKVDLDGIDDLRDFEAFDSRYTAPMHGFDSADAYYKYARLGPVPERHQGAHAAGECAKRPVSAGVLLSPRRGRRFAVCVSGNPAGGRARRLSGRHARWRILFGATGRGVSHG